MVSTTFTKIKRIGRTPEFRAKSISCLIGTIVSFGAFYATHDLNERHAREPAVAKTAPVKFRAAVSPAPSSVAPQKVLPLEVSVTPVKQDLKTSSLKKAETEQRIDAKVVESTEKFSAETLMAIRQAPENVNLPLIPAGVLPPVPSADAYVDSDSLTKLFDDKPGGDIVVLGLLLNDQGIVIDSKILLPSGYVLGDMTVALASIGQRWESLVPPLLPGEVRWIEQRIDQRTIEPILGTQLP